MLQQLDAALEPGGARPTLLTLLACSACAAVGDGKRPHCSYFMLRL